MSQKVRVVTWKMAPHRYLHEVIAERCYFYIITDSDCFSLRSFTIRNKVSAKRLIRETGGLRKIREERDEWLGNDEWAILCFSGCNNLELRKKVYGREQKKVMIRLEIYSGGRIDRIYVRKENDSSFSENLILYGHSVRLMRNLKKRIKNPLPSIINQRVEVMTGETHKLYVYTVSEVSYILFLKKLKDWGWW